MKQIWGWRSRFWYGVGWDELQPVWARKTAVIQRQAVLCTRSKQLRLCNLLGDGRLSIYGTTQNHQSLTRCLGNCFMNLLVHDVICGKMLLPKQCKILRSNFRASTRKCNRSRLGSFTQIIHTPVQVGFQARCDKCRERRVRCRTRWNSHRVALYNVVRTSWPCTDICRAPDTYQSTNNERQTLFCISFIKFGTQRYRLMLTNMA